MARKKWQWITALSSIIIPEDQNADGEEIRLAKGESCKITVSYAEDLERNGLVELTTAPKGNAAKASDGDDAIPDGGADGSDNGGDDGTTAGNGSGDEQSGDTDRTGESGNGSGDAE